MIDQLNKLRDEALAELSSIHDLGELEVWRVKYLGKKGALTAMLRQLGTLSPEERPAVGQAANQVKARLESQFAEKEAELQQAARALAMERERVDVTLPGRPLALGQLHPTTRVLKEILDAFVTMGFQVVEGPEVEWDYYNFEALNIPKDHPARDMWDTFYVSMDGKPGEMLLRTHTSPNQVRVMEKTRPPVRVIVPGKCYRYEAIDPSHESMFYQVEGLAIDENITFADMKGTLSAFARMLFGQDRKVRFRCDYFPFVEPGVDMSIDCYVCKGAGCRLCGSTGWLEIMGAGMVHPKELERVGYDPSVYSGFAFGLGPERIAMLKSGIDDIRLFYSNDLRFLRQFR
ncbi:MAG: phenylalanine--tRNA ligase subunit alpha [Chloroflexi bacterium]|nr:phenylalanine--tRNA ligase subunit alpha [Chloroflexota bacterium]MDA8189212.1 phenylalanine--tRNA ligase subunit alpha [Dehalococcoidales bacterium]